jgi:hypothetical protein
MPIVMPANAVVANGGLVVNWTTAGVPGILEEVAEKGV